MLDLSGLPMWLQPLFGEKFFDACLAHPKESKNENNILCWDCRKPICTHCSGDHSSHKLLQIRRYMYRDVLKLGDAGKLMNCARVQSYISNGERVVFLKTTPQKRTLKSTSRKCNVCSKGIQQNFAYCSLSCKLEFLHENGELKNLPESGPGEVLKAVSVVEESGSGTTEICSENSVRAEISSTSDVEEAGRRRRRKKGTPCRAPLH